MMDSGRTNRTPQRFRNTDDRAFPIPSVTITGTTSGAAHTIVTGPALEMLEITRLTVTNTTGTAATLTLHAVPSGDAIGSGNKELDAYNIPANTTLRVDGLLGQIYPASTTIQVYSGTNGALNIRGAALALQ